MIRRLLMPCLAAVFVLSGCASTAQVKRSDPVTIVLVNGDKIRAEVIDIHKNKIIFKAHDWKKAYEYGEIINVERVKAVKLGDGRRLSVREYDAFRKGEAIKSGREVARRKRPRRKRTAAVEENLRYEEIKNKRISEMTDNEFNFFMMMEERKAQVKSDSQAAKAKKSAKKREKEAPVEVIVIGPQNHIPILPKVSVPPPVIVPAPEVQPDVALDEIAASLFDANLAVAMLNHLNNKRELTTSEASLLKLIQSNPEWQEKLDDLAFVNRTAERSMERAFLYNPDELGAKLGLSFDKDVDLDYLDMMAQLHRKLGEDVKISDFRTMLDVFGESGSRAVREILENYDSWQFAISKNGFATK